MTPLVAKNAALTQRLAEAEATIEALISGQVDAVVDGREGPVLLTKAQDALRSSEERYRQIVETANEGIWTIDANSITTFMNGRMASMLGYTQDEVIGMPLHSIVSKAEQPKAMSNIESGRHGRRSESVFLRKDGTELWVSVSSTPRLNSAGEYIGALAMVTDRTEQHEAEDALRRSEAQYRQIVETTTDGIITVDRDGQVLFVNKRLAEMLGYQPQEMVGKPAFTFMSPVGQAVAKAAFKRRAAGASDSNDSVFLHRNGTEVTVHVAGTPVVDAKGNHTGSMAVVRDVTERRRLQSQLMVSDRMASVGTLAAGVAHEINNPLAAVMANLDYIADIVGQLGATNRNEMSPAMRETWARDEIKAPLDDAREAAERVRFIVRDLKMFSRSPTEEVKGSVNVKSVMESSLRMAWNEVRHRARLVKNYGHVPDVDANEARLGQVFLNLIVNAAQAIPEGNAESNEITVTTRLEGNRVIIEVADTGPGIAPEIINRVFDAFFTTKGVGVGTGLGLAICHRIVTDIGGELTVRSQPGAGTVFRVSLPEAVTEAVTVAPAPVAAGSRRGRILIVDDEEMIIRILKKILKEHDVVATVDAREALELCARGERFDLILCDLMMPVMTGMDLHSEISLVSPEQARAMIFVTGGAFTEKTRSFLSDVPKEHIEKPFDAANLRAIVQRYLR
ncbi:MAG TPA: PAS domain S-box protein [Gemmatimonadaceae bacterium]|nr:PAS domain S-box protein [Gemmatimonadaceae bacterium]